MPFNNRLHKINPKILSPKEYVELLKKIKEEESLFETVNTFLGITNDEMKELVNPSLNHERLHDLIKLIYIGVKAFGYIPPNFVIWFCNPNPITGVSPFEHFASGNNQKDRVLIKHLNQISSDVYH